MSLDDRPGELGAWGGRSSINGHLFWTEKIGTIMNPQSQ